MASVVFDVIKSLSVYASYSDIYLKQSTYLDHNENVADPITGDNIEAGIKWDPRGGQLNASLAVYRIEQSGFVALDGPRRQIGAVTYCCYRTDTDLKRISSGIDSEVNGEVQHGW